MDCKSTIFIIVLASFLDLRSALQQEQKLRRKAEQIQRHGKEAGKRKFSDFKAWKYKHEHDLPRLREAKDVRGEILAETHDVQLQKLKPNIFSEEKKRSFGESDKENKRESSLRLRQRKNIDEDDDFDDVNFDGSAENENNKAGRLMEPDDISDYDPAEREDFAKEDDSNDARNSEEDADTESSGREEEGDDREEELREEESPYTKSKLHKVQERLQPKTRYHFRGKTINEAAEGALSVVENFFTPNEEVDMASLSNRDNFDEDGRPVILGEGKGNSLIDLLTQVVTIT